MLATESVDDGEKMTGLWRRERLCIKKEKGSEGRWGGGLGEFKGWIQRKDVDEERELGWKEDGKLRLDALL